MDSKTTNVEILSESVRTSCRKSKRRTFDDFVSTEEVFENDPSALESSSKMTKRENKGVEFLIRENTQELNKSEQVKKEHDIKELEKITTQKRKIGVSNKSHSPRAIRRAKKRGPPKTNQNNVQKMIHNNVTKSKEAEINESLKERKEKHSCKKSNCRKEDLICCLQATNMCMEASGKCSRWYHMSLEEHYCNGCFEQYYRVKHSGCEEFHEWKRQWMQNSKTDATFKNLTTYISERQLPYWVQCNTCSYWRQLTNEIELTPEIVSTYVCNMGNLSNTMEDDNKESCLAKRSPHVKYLCYKNQDPGVETANDPSVSWMPLLSYTPFLKNSPAAPFLTEYYPDGVGMSAVDTVNVRELEEFASDSSENDVIMPPNIKRLRNQKKFNAITSQPEKHNQAIKTSMMMSPGGRKQRETSVTTVPVKKLNPYFQPFYKPHEDGKACCMRPDVMELDEAEEFPEYYRDQSVYLALRNVIVALWALNPKQILTAKKCFPHILFRGLTRTRLCTLVAPRVIQFATRKGLINTGALRLPKTIGDSKTSGLLPEIYTNQKVVVIGCGPAGLAAARQLHNFGCEVVCLEARDRVGGRVHDDWSLDGVCVGTGAQIINGCVNNPLALISHQLDLKLHILRSRCDLFDGEENNSSGENLPVSSHYDKRMDFHFNALLDIIAEWRQAQEDLAEDCSLGEKILEAHHEWIKQSGLAFTKLEERLLNFHIGNLEFACGANLDNVSAFNWDQNEIFSQFCGEHAFVQYGFDTPLSALATDLNIKYKSEVTDIMYSKKKPMVEVRTSNGEIHHADRVLVTVPLAVLRSGSIKFHPDLPKSKKQSMNRLGCGCIEKVGLLFSNRFWDKKIDGANYFGYVPTSTSKKGFFTMFYDVPYVTGEKSNVLMSVLSGDSVELAQHMSDEEIIDIALSNLQNIFREIKIEKPLKFFVTRWRDDPYAQMAYSYVKKGSSGEDYDEMAVEIENRIYFAGEGTNRHFPQTVTGAYLSGLREASKIAVANAEEKTGCELGHFPIENLLDLKK